MANLALMDGTTLSEIETAMLLRAQNTPLYEGYEEIIQTEEELWSQ